MIRIRRFASESAWLAAIEDDFLDAIRAAAPGSPVLCLSGGTTPAPAYRRLAAALLREQASDAPRALLVVGDERDGPIPARYRNDEAIKAAWAAALAAGRASLLRWERSPLEPAAMDRRLAALASTRPPGLPLFDLCYLGLGADGHTAGLFPGEPALEAGFCAAPEQDARTSASGINDFGAGRAVARALRGRAPDFPHERLSLSFEALRSSCRTRYLVRSTGKEAALAALESGDPSCPAVRAASADALAFVLD